MEELPAVPRSGQTADKRARVEDHADDRLEPTARKLYELVKKGRVSVIHLYALEGVASGLSNSEIAQREGGPRANKFTIDHRLGVVIKETGIVLPAGRKRVGPEERKLLGAAYVQVKAWMDTDGIKAKERVTSSKKSGPRPKPPLVTIVHEHSRPPHEGDSDEAVVEEQEPAPEPEAARPESSEPPLPPTPVSSEAQAEEEPEAATPPEAPAPAPTASEEPEEVATTPRSTELAVIPAESDMGALIAAADISFKDPDTVLDAEVLDPRTPTFRKDKLELLHGGYQFEGFKTLVLARAVVNLSIFVKRRS